MNFKTIFPMSAVLLTMIVLVGSKEAKAVELGITVGGGHHYRNGGVVEYRTADPVYSTWYPSDSTYVYTPPVTVIDNSSYGYGYYDTPYVYSTNTGDYNGWYGSGRTGHGGLYGNGRYERRSSSSYSGSADHRGGGRR